MVPAFHSFNRLVTRSQARKSSCTGKSSISPPDGRSKTDAMEWFPAYVDLHIAQARTALPLILLECTCVTSEFDFPRSNMHPTTPLQLECSRINMLVTSMNDLLTVWKSLVEEDTFLSKDSLGLQQYISGLYYIRSICKYPRSYILLNIAVGRFTDNVQERSGKIFFMGIVFPRELL